MPKKGKLKYRGINIEEIIEACERENRFGFEEVAYLLIFGSLPSKEQLALFQKALGLCRKLPDDFIEDVIMKNASFDVMNEMARGRGTQFDPEALDAFFRLVEKGVIDPDKLYAQKSAEIQHADQKAQEELRRRVEEDRKIQAAEMKGEQKTASPKESGETATDASAGKGA